MHLSFTYITCMIDFDVVCLHVSNIKSDGSWVISDGSWVTYQMGQWVMGQFQWPIACSGSNSYNFRMQPNIQMKFAGYVAWILLCKHCKFGEKNYYNSGRYRIFCRGLLFLARPGIYRTTVNWQRRIKQRLLLLLLLLLLQDSWAIGNVFTLFHSCWVGWSAVVCMALLHLNVGFYTWGGRKECGVPQSWT